MSRASRRKGAEGEREFCRELGELLGVDLMRRIQQTRDSGHDVDGLEGFAVEVKRVEALSLGRAWTQAQKAADTIGMRPAVAHRANREPWRVYVSLSLDEFADFVRTHNGKQEQDDA